MKSRSILLFLQVRHKFELIFLEVSAKNKELFFFKSLQEQNITSPLTGVSNAYGSYRSYGSFLGILKYFADGVSSSHTAFRLIELLSFISILIANRYSFNTQPHRYPYNQACLQGAVNRLSGAALNLICAYVSENTGRIRRESLNALLEVLRQAFDNPDRTRTANRKIRKLKQKKGTFAAYFAEFGRIMGDLNWNKEAQREQLDEGLSDEIKDALVTSHPYSDSVVHLIQI